MVAFRSKVEPDICTYVDKQENSLTVEIVLPGVLKENITLKVNTSSLLIFAAADDVNYAKYISLCHPVVPDRAKAVYGHGLLRIKLPFRA